MGLPAGFNFRANDAPIDRIQIPAMTVDLISQGDGVEVIRQELDQEAIIGMRPEEGWTALEALYVLKGRLRIQTNGMILGPGDGLSACPVREPLLMEALEPSSVLYISSEPVFHLYRQDLGDLFALATDVEVKDGNTRFHCRRIQRMSVAVGSRLSLTSEELYALTYGSFLHDIGKVRIPDPILGKPGPLSLEEWAIMRTHAVLGEKILLEKPFLKSAARVARQHHERLDGSGYPDGLSGSEISVEAGIVAVVDTYDAMTSQRVYRETPGPRAAREVLFKGRGLWYYPETVDAFLSILDSGGLPTPTFKE